MGVPKAFLEYSGETFIYRLKRILGEFCNPVIVVSAPDSILSGDRPGAVGHVVNPHPEQGMLSSLQCGLRAVSKQTDAVLFTLVDLPAISTETVQALVNGWHGETLRIPRFNGRSGHPVILASALIPEFLEANGTPKDVISRHAAEIVYVDVDDPGVVTDVDTPDDYKNLPNAIAAGRR